MKKFLTYFHYALAIPSAVAVLIISILGIVLLTEPIASNHCYANASRVEPTTKNVPSFLHLRTMVNKSLGDSLDIESITVNRDTTKAILVTMNDDNSSSYLVNQYTGQVGCQMRQLPFFTTCNNIIATLTTSNLLCIVVILAVISGLALLYINPQSTSHKLYKQIAVPSSLLLVVVAFITLLINNTGTIDLNRKATMMEMAAPPMPMPMMPMGENMPMMPHHDDMPFVYANPMGEGFGGAGMPMPFDGFGPKFEMLDCRNMEVLVDSIRSLYGSDFDYMTVSRSTVRVSVCKPLALCQSDFYSYDSTSGEITNPINPTVVDIFSAIDRCEIGVLAKIFLMALALLGISLSATVFVAFIRQQ